MAKHDSFCLCAGCVKRWQKKQDRQQRSSNSRGYRHGRGRSGYSAPMGGGDSAGNPLIVSFGEGGRENETLLADDVQEGENFLASENHNHYGSGSGSNDNVKDRGKYTGEGS